MQQNNSRERFVAFLQGLAQSNDRGALAALRKGLGRPPGRGARDAPVRRALVPVQSGPAGRRIPTTW